MALRPEHEIHVHGTGMEGHDAGHKKKTADVDEGPPVPRCMLKDRSQARRFRTTWVWLFTFRDGAAGQHRDGLE